MNEINQNNLENNVKDYIDNWLAHGAPPQKYEVFSKLTLAMPAPCVELWCISKDNNDWYLWCTQRGPEDRDFPYVWHSIGCAAMLTDFIGPESEYLISKVSFLEKIFEMAKEDQLRYNLKTPRDRIIQRILRKDSGIKDEDFILSLLDKPVNAGIYYNLTPRGAEVIDQMVFEATAYKDKFTGGKWFKIDILPQMAKEGNFVPFQVERLQKALENWNTIR